MSAEPRQWQPNLLPVFLQGVHSNVRVEQRVTAGPAEQYDPGRINPDDLAGGRIDDLGLDARRAVEAVAQDPDDAVTLEWVGRHHREGESYQAIAREAGISYGVVLKRVSRLTKRLGRISGAMLTVLLPVLFSKTADLQGDPRNEVARRHEIGPDPRIPEPAASVSPAERALRLRARGLDQCAAGRYAACLEALDAASAVDPAGDADEPVQEARRAADEALDLDRKSKAQDRSEQPPPAP